MYLFVGGGTTVVDWIIFTILVFLLPDLSALPFFSHFPNAIEYTVAWAGAVLFAYWASKYFVFETAKKEGFSQFMKFVGSCRFVKRKNREKVSKLRELRESIFNRLDKLLL